MSKSRQKEYGKADGGQLFSSAADAAVTRKVTRSEWLLTVPPAAHSVAVFRSSLQEAAGLASARWALS
ncbi:MAG: hypothetical protein WBV74_00320 [Pseudonocardiaceae bacterium]